MKTKYQIPLISTFSLLVLLLSASTVNASGFLVYDQGADAMGKANAVTASVTDPNAVFYNPAGLSFSKGYALFLGSNLTFLRI